MTGHILTLYYCDGIPSMQRWFVMASAVHKMSVSRLETLGEMADMICERIVRHSRANFSCNLVPGVNDEVL